MNCSVKKLFVGLWFFVFFRLHSAGNQATMFECDLDADLVEHSIAHAPEKIKRMLTRVTSKKYIGPKPKKLLLHGPSGSGKTTLAQAFAQRCGYECKVVHGPAIGDRFHNSGSQDLVEILQELQQLQEPTVVVIDEITALTRDYGKKMNYDNKTVEALWLFLDGCAALSDVIVIATTNYVDKLPQQLKDRFNGALIEIPAPDYHERYSLIMHYLSDDNDCYESDVNYIARWTKGCSVRVIKNIIEDAQAYALELDECLSYQHLYKAACDNGVTFSWLTWYIPKITWDKETKETVWTAVQFAAPLCVSIIGICLQTYQAYKASRENHMFQEENRKLQMKLHENNLEFQAETQEVQLQFQHSMAVWQNGIQQKLHQQGMDAQEKAYDHQANVGYWSGIPIVGPMIGSARNDSLRKQKEEQKQKLQAIEQGKASIAALPSKK